MKWFVEGKYYVYRGIIEVVCKFLKEFDNLVEYDDDVIVVFDVFDVKGIDVFFLFEGVMKYWCIDCFVYFILCIIDVVKYVDLLLRLILILMYFYWSIFGGWILWIS